MESRPVASLRITPLHSEYLEVQVQRHVTAEMTRDHIQRLCRALFDPLLQRASRRLLSSKKNTGPNIPDFLATLFLEELARATEGLAKKPDCSSLLDVSVDTLHGHATADFLKEVLGRARDEEKQEITDVVHHMSKAELAQLADSRAALLICVSA